MASSTNTRRWRRLALVAAAVGAIGAIAGPAIASGITAGVRLAPAVAMRRLADNSIAPLDLATGMQGLPVLRTGAEPPIADPSDPPAPAPPPPAPAPGSPSGSVFGPASFWRTSIRTAPLAADSALQVADLLPQLNRYNGNAAFSLDAYNTSFYTVAANAPRADVRFDDCQGKGYVPAGLYGPGGQFTAVPIPAYATPAAGTDAELTVYSPATDQLWEFWEAARRADGWHACWGGRLDHVSSSPGYFSGGFGATATGLPVAGGMVSVADARAGRIDHAVGLLLVAPAMWNRVSWPAQRSDGYSSNAHAIAEGTRLRLDPSVNVDALGLSPIAAMVAKAAQTYGFVVIDKSGAVGIQAESGAGYVAATGSNPWPALLGHTASYDVMHNFPWNRLQVLPASYGKP